MRTIRLAAVAASALLVTAGGAEARHRHGATHASHHGSACRLGLFYRPSTGACTRSVPREYRVAVRPVRHAYAWHGRHAWAARHVTHAVVRHAPTVIPRTVAGVIAATARAAGDALRASRVTPWAGALTRPQVWQ